MQAIFFSFRVLNLRDALPGSRAHSALALPCVKRGKEVQGIFSPFSVGLVLVA